MKNKDIIQSLLDEELSYKDCNMPHSQTVIASCNAWLNEDDFYRLRDLEKNHVKD